MQLPCIEVSQLAPSTSFYAAVLQPLGLRYLTLESAASGPGFAAFGCGRSPVLHLRQVARPATVRMSSIRISAPSHAAIQAFYRQGIEANPASTFPVEHFADHATISDLDGNMMQAVYTGLVCGPEMITGQCTLILNPQQETRLCQVLVPGTCTAEPTCAESIDAGGGTKDVANPQAFAGEKADTTQAKTENTNAPSGGISTVLGALIGVAAGAAAGAAITYGVMSAGTPDLAPSERNSRQRSLPKNGQASDAAGISTGLVDRDHSKPIPLRQHRIKFHEDRPSSPKKPSTRPTTSVHESEVLQTQSKDIEHDDREENGKQLVRIPRNTDLGPVKSRSRISASVPAMNSSSTRQLALPPPANSSPGTGTNVTEDPPSEKEVETFVSAQARVSSSSVYPGRASQRSSEPTKATTSSPSKRDHSKKPPNKRDSCQKSYVNKPSGSKSSSEPHSKEVALFGARSTTQATELSQRSSKTDSGRPETSESFDTRSQAEARQTDISASRNNNSGEDTRSRISARDVPLPSSRVGSSSEFFDTRSHISARKTDLSAGRNSSGKDTRSRISARDIPLPSSRVGRTSELLDTRSHTSARKTDLSASRNNNSDEDKRSRVSARNIRLPSSWAGTSEFFDTRSHASARKTDLSASRNNNSDEDKRSRVSARDIPLPSSRVGASEFFDTVSHVSARKANSSANCKGIGGAVDSHSHISARNVPLPASCVDCGSKVADRISHVSARNIPLPASGVGADYHDGSMSHLSARNVPLPGSHVGSSRAHWDDDARSIAPSDSISCIGSK